MRIQYRIPFKSFARRLVCTCMGTCLIHGPASRGDLFSNPGGRHAFILPGQFLSSEMTCSNFKFLEEISNTNCTQREHCCCSPRRPPCPARACGYGSARFQRCCCQRCRGCRRHLETPHEGGETGPASGAVCEGSQHLLGREQSCPARPAATNWKFRVEASKFWPLEWPVASSGVNH